MHVLGTYRSITRYTSFYTLKYVALSSVVFSNLHLADFSGGHHQFARLGADSVWTAGLHVSEHVATGHWLSLFVTVPARSWKAITIYGAGEAGRQLLTSLNQSPTYKPAVFIDDDKVMHGLRVGDVKVLGFADAVESFEAKKISTVLIAIPSATFEQRSSIIEKLEPHAIKVKALPSVSELIEGKAGRQPVEKPHC